MGRSPSPWLLAAVLAASPAAAQNPGPAPNQGLVVRDGTLGENPPGVVAPGIDPSGQYADYLITPELGEQGGRNLFHSFSAFGIGEGETATFTGPDPVDGPQSVSNVISRVTGGDPSEIDGTLRSAIPGAEVWLLNPSGVVFGEGATLDVPGSFHASTGDYVGFGEGGLERFYADGRPSSVLSTARPEAFGFLGESAPAAISVTGAVLEVEPGKGLELAGGDVTLSAATLDAPAGSISIRGGQIVVQEGSRILAENAGNDPAGSITIEASESLLVDDSLLSVSTDSAGDAGQIFVTSPEVTFQNGPGLANFYEPDDPSNLPHRVTVGARAETTSSGKAGTLEIDADALTLTAGAGLSAQTVGPDGAFASGDGGDIRIRAGSVLVSDLGFATVESWRSTGDAGSITVGSREAPADTLTIDGTRADGLGSYPTTLTATSLARRWVTLSDRLDFGPAYDPADLALGEAGTIEIWARAVDLVKGGSIEAWCIDCVTRGGTIRVTAQEMKLDEGTLRPVLSRSLVSAEAVGPAARGGGGSIFVDLTGALLVRGEGFLSVGTKGDRDAGTIAVRADSVSLTEGAGVFAGSSGSGNAGTITIGADSVTLSEGGGIHAGTSGSGDGGTITIGADSVNLDAGGMGVDTNGPGDAGTITIDAESLNVTDGGFINALTFQSGDAGTITIDADSLLLSGSGPDFGSRILAGAEAGATGNAGAIVITAHALVIEHGAYITAGIQTTPLFGRSRGGDAGRIHVSASGSIFLSSEGEDRFSLAKRLFQDLLPNQEVGTFTGISAATVYGGAGGSVTLEAPEITVSHGAMVTSATVGGGAGGTVDLRGERIRVVEGGNVNSVSLRLFGDILGGDAGDVTLTGTESIEVAGANPAFPEDPSSVTSSTLGAGAAGALTLRAPRIVVEAGGRVTTSALPARFHPGEGGARGNIALEADQVIVRGGGRIDASTFVDEPGGDIEVVAHESILVEGAESGIGSRTGRSGAGGSVALRAPRIQIARGGEVTAESSLGYQGVSTPLLEAEGFVDPDQRRDGSLKPATGDAGAIRIDAKELVHLDAGTITSSVTGAAGGDIFIGDATAPEAMILENGSRIAATAEAGTGGEISIIAANYFAFPEDIVVSADAGNPELSGTVAVNTPDVNLAGQLSVLPTSYLDAASLMRERCAARRSGERAGSFAVRGSDGIPAEPDGWLPATAGFAETPTANLESKARSTFATPPLLAATGCP